MLDWLFKRAASPPPRPQQKPRGILPFVAEGRVTIRKAALQVKNTYEVRLGLFMAVEHAHLPFVLAVPPGATVAEDLRAKITQYDGAIIEEAVGEFSVYFGAESHDGTELDGWVLGDQGALAQLVEAVGSEWLGPAIVPGTQFVGEQLAALWSVVSRAPLVHVNVDGEDVKQALLALIKSARASRGKVYVQ